MNDDLQDAFKHLSKTAKPRQQSSGARVSAKHGGVAIHAGGNVTVVNGSGGGGGSGGGPGKRRPFLRIGFNRVFALITALFFSGVLAYWVVPAWRGVGPEGGGLPAAMMLGLPSLDVLLVAIIACALAGLAATTALYLRFPPKAD